VLYSERGTFGDLVACDLADGDRSDQAGGWSLTTGTGFRPPAAAVAGALVATAELSFDYDDGVQSQINVVSLKGRPDVWSADVVYGPYAGGTSGAKIISMALEPDGAIAWTTCQRQPALRDELSGARDAPCERPGAGIWVYTHQSPQPGGSFVPPFQPPPNVPPAPAAYTAVAHGNDIDPRSLRIVGSRVTWIEHGAVRSAPLD
jgi:hypothetical protein